MGRLFQHLRLTHDACMGLREAVRPFMPVDRAPDENAVEFCERVYLAFYVLESDTDKESVDFPVSVMDVMLINNCVSSEDGEWAKDVLHQTRQALYELKTSRGAVRLASSDETRRLLEGIEIELGDEEDGQKSP